MDDPASPSVPVQAGASSLAALLIIALVVTIIWPPHALFIWNASASSPVGLYEVMREQAGEGDMVVAWPPRNVRSLAAARHYIPSNVPLVKPVAAVRGARVCAFGSRIFVNGRLAAIRRAHDPSGRPMPWWSGCKRLREGELFLLSTAAPGSFDGRYFGPTRAQEFVGKAKLLWRR